MWNLFCKQAWDFTYVKLGRGYVFHERCKGFLLKKLEAEKVQTYFIHEYAIAKLKSTVLYLVFRKSVSNWRTFNYLFKHGS